MVGVVNLVTPPVVEPVLLDEAKAWLRLEIPDDDALVGSLITAARRVVETRARLTPVFTTFALALDNFPFGGGYFNRTIRQQFATGVPGAVSPSFFPTNQGVIELPRSPLSSVVSVAYQDVNNTPQTLDPSVYRAIPGAPGRVVPQYDHLWPVVAPVLGAVTVTWVAGFGPDGSTTPETLKTAIKALVAYWYENREAAVGESVPGYVDALISAEDVGQYG